MNGDRQLYALFFFTFKPRDKNISDILHALTPAGNLLSFYQMSHLSIDTWSEMLFIFNGLWLLALWPLQVYYWYGNAVVFVTCSDIDSVLIFGDFAVSNSLPHILFCTCSPIPSLKDVLDWSLILSAIFFTLERLLWGLLWMMKEELGFFFFYPSLKYKKLFHQVGVLNSLMMFPCYGKQEHIFKFSSLHFQWNRIEISNSLKLSRKMIHITDTSKEASIKPCPHIISWIQSI